MSRTFDQGREEVAKLCKYFANNRHDFFTLGVKEAHVRQSLIDPFFEALGWDMRNAAMTALQYREVIPEDSLEIEGQQKAPDYTFRVGTLAKFYTEAKKCGVNINADPGPAYQLRRYGWSAKVPLSILTDFEELGVYDCSLRPQPTDKASFGRIQYYRSEEYPDRWRELWEIFSREAVWAGAYDRYAASKRKRGTSEVDSEFLKEIESWRDSLARNIALRNQFLSPDDLNAAVQRTIDRVIFLRMAEDRGSESYGQLLKLCEQANIYSNFMSKSCRNADEKYNSGLFHFRKEEGITESLDSLTPKLHIDDKVFKPILQSLYFEHGSPYHFGVLPVEILGTVYERFLGKVIRLTHDHRAKVEEKPEVRKAGGVYYTPAYIVDYIVKNTVGKMIEGKSPAQLTGSKNGQPLRVLDMACGSGSFLLGAYQCLLDHYLKWYLENHPEKHKEAVYLDRRGKYWRLAIAEKKRILITHIFGVDIDLQAVEVSKLSLLLKVLEGETDETVGQSRQLFHDRALPNLSNNIKCGNSLIGPDYFSGHLIPDPDEMKRVNPFDWQREFPDSMKSGGFDCVIGNPPYLAGREWGEELGRQRTYFIDHYNCMTDQYDLYALFIQKSVELLRESGNFGFITPTTWLNNEHYITLRKWLITNTEIVLIGDYRDVKVFSAVTVLPIVLVAYRKKYPLKKTICLIEKFSEPGKSISFESGVSYWEQFPNLIFNLSISKQDLPILKRIEEKSKPCKTFADVRFGVKVYQQGKGKPKQSEKEALEKCFEAERKKGADYFLYLWGEHVTAWHVKSGNTWLKYGPHLAEPRTFELFTGPRILLRRIVGERLILCPTTDTLIADQLLHTVKPRFEFPNYLFLAGVLSSKLISYFFRKRFNRTEKTFPEIRIAELSSLPIHDLDFTNKTDKVAYEKIVKLAEQMLDLHKQIAQMKSGMRMDIIKRQIEATDREINRLVYELYGLTEEEIKIVEIK